MKKLKKSSKSELLGYLRKFLKKPSEEDNEYMPLSKLRKPEGYYNWWNKNEQGE